jgi:hypothetical protein
MFAMLTGKEEEEGIGGPKEHWVDASMPVSLQI